MRPRFIPTWAALALLSLNTVLGSAQQNSSQAQAQKSKPAPKPAPSGTLLVICDLSCYWNLDGETNGHADAEKSVKLRVMPGEHIVKATSEDGVDQVQQIADVKEGKQKLVNIELWPLRLARLEAEQEKAAEAASAEQDRQEREKLRQQREKEAAEGYWTDPDTGLQWSTTTYEGRIDWRSALRFCSDLEVAGHVDWQLPTMQELRVYVSDATKAGVLHASGWHWSKTVGPNGDMLLENIDDGEQEPVSSYSDFGGVLCVRQNLR